MRPKRIGGKERNPVKTSGKKWTKLALISVTLFLFFVAGWKWDREKKGPFQGSNIVFRRKLTLCENGQKWPFRERQQVFITGGANLCLYT
jgi:hypothetical protein